MAFNSVNTNSAASVALENLNSTNQQLQTLQTQISTGLQISSPADNGATWAIAQNVRAQISSWGAVSDSLARGQSILAVAASGAAQIGDLLQQLKAQAVSLNDASLDATSQAAVQANMTALVQQIDQAANTASFDGVDLLNAPVTGVEVTSFEQSGPTLSTQFNGQITGFGAWCPLTASLTSATYTSAADGSTTNLNPPPMYPAPAGDQHEDWTLAQPLGPGTLNFTFDAAPGDYYGFDVQGVLGPPVNIISDPNGGSTRLSQWNLTSAGLGLGSLDWSDPQSILTAIDAAIPTVTKASETIGAQQNGLSTLQTSASKMQDSLNTGLGNLVDADVAQDSAQLQALQVKQQLGAQALSIANGAPSLLLSLFKNLG